MSGECLPAYAARALPSAAARRARSMRTPPKRLPPALPAPDRISGHAAFETTPLTVHDRLEKAHHAGGGLLGQVGGVPFRWRYCQAAAAVQGGAAWGLEAGVRVVVRAKQMTNKYDEPPGLT